MSSGISLLSKWRDVEEIMKVDQVRLLELEMFGRVHPIGRRRFMKEATRGIVSSVL